MRRISRILAFSVLIIPGAAFAAPASSPFLVRHGTIVDPARGTAYVAKPNGTIDAVDLASGRTLWTSADAALPLGADQDLLVAQVEERPLRTERFQVAILDAASGGKLSEATIILPAGVSSFVADEKAGSFRAVAEREGGLFLVSWYYQENLGQGITRPGESTWRFFAGSALLRSSSSVTASYPNRGLTRMSAASSASTSLWRYTLSGSRPTLRSGRSRFAICSHRHIDQDVFTWRA